MGASFVVSLTHLEEIDLHGTEVGDPGMAHIARLTALRQLDLRGCRIQDQGLAHLHELSKLKHLQLGDAPVSPTAVAKLIAAIASLDVFYEWRCTIRELDGEPALVADWLTLIFEGGELSKESSGKIQICGHNSSSNGSPSFYSLRDWTSFPMVGLSWAHTSGLAIVDFVTKSRDDPSKKAEWRAQFTECGRTLTYRGRTIRLPTEPTTINFGRDGSVSVDGEVIGIHFDSQRR